MKTLRFFPVFFLLFQFVSAQDYQCVKQDAEYFFYSDTDYRAIKIDTVEYQGNKQIHFNFTVLGKFDTAFCYSGDWPSWIGKKVEIDDEGKHTFYNLDNEQVLIEAHAGLNEEWFCYSFGNGNYIDATVSEIEELEFLGLTDSVKTISFQAKTSEGNNFSHTINYLNLQISKNYGFVKAINFKVFPDLIDTFWYEECQEYELYGISYPVTGIQNLSIDKIFDYEIGDEIHIHQHSWVSTVSTDQKKILTVINKEYLSNDEIIYTFSRCGRNMFWDWGTFDTIYFYNDTLIETVNLPDYTYPYVNAVPYNLFAAGDVDYKTYFWMTQSFNEERNKMEKTSFNGFFSIYPHDCIQEIITDNKSGFDDYFLEGLGGPYVDQFDIWGTSRKVVYYKKGIEEWGEPYYCDSLLTGIKQTKITIDKVVISPNPIRNTGTISFNNPDSQEISLNIYNSQGNEVLSEKTTTNKFIIHATALEAGMYFYVLKKKDQKYFSGKLLVQ